MRATDEIERRKAAWWYRRIEELGPVRIPAWYMDELHKKFAKFCRDCGYPCNSQVRDSEEKT